MSERASERVKERANGRPTVCASERVAECICVFAFVCECMYDSGTTVKVFSLFKLPLGILNKFHFYTTSNVLLTSTFRPTSAVFFNN